MLRNHCKCIMKTICVIRRIHVKLHRHRCWVVRCSVIVRSSVLVSLECRVPRATDLPFYVGVCGCDSTSLHVLQMISGLAVATHTVHDHLVLCLTAPPPPGSGDIPGVSLRAVTSRFARGPRWRSTRPTTPESGPSAVTSVGKGSPPNTGCWPTTGVCIVLFCLFSVSSTDIGTPTYRRGKTVKHFVNTFVKHCAAIRVCIGVWAGAGRVFVRLTRVIGSVT